MKFTMCLVTYVTKLLQLDDNEPSLIDGTRFKKSNCQGDYACPQGHFH